MKTVWIPNIFVPQSSKGILYDAAWGRTSGEIILRPQTTAIAIPVPTLPVGLIRSAGYGLILASLAGIFFSYQPVITNEVSYRLSTLFRDEAKERALAAQAEGERLAALEQVQLEKEAKEKAEAALFAQQYGLPDTKFSLYIPKINAKAGVTGNVNPADEQAYTEALKLGIAHAAGSSFPSQDGGTYLFAHSTNAAWNVSRYNAVFYLIKELDPEKKDEIDVLFLDKLYRYTVTQKHIVDADDTSWYINAASGSKRLILQTCWPPGTTWKRLIIVAEPTQEAPLAVET